MAEPWSIYVLPCNGNPEFMEIPINEWKNRFNWKYMHNRTVEAPYVTEHREVRLMTVLHAEDNQSWLGLDETPVPVNPVVPSMQGTVVLACFLEGNGKELPVNVRDLYGMRGIRVILRKPWRGLHRERIPCNMNYIERKVAELQSMPEEE